MAEFPPNLDDGELWLPSDIFPNEVPSRYSPHFPCTDDLAQHFAKYTLLQPNPTIPIPPPNLERFRPPVRQVAVGSPSSRHCIVNGGLGVGHILYSYGTGDFCAGPRPFYQYYFFEPAHPQVESFPQMRAMVLQRQQNSFQNRVLPVQGSGVGMGGFVRKSGGTGVFLPRFTTTNTTTTTSTLTNVRKKQGVRNRQEVQVAQQRPSISRVPVGKQDECHCQISPEMGLPQDWTY